MSREIKFRAWDKIHEEYITDKVLLAPDGRVISRYGFDSCDSFLIVNDVVIEFDTGFKDKNGKEICDGDIVKYLSYRKEYIGQVVFDFVDDSEGYYVEKHYGWGIRRDGYNLSLGDYADEDMKCELVEVIGNIHENPELLEKGE